MLSPFRALEHFHAYFVRTFVKFINILVISNGVCMLLGVTHTHAHCEGVYVVRMRKTGPQGAVCVAFVLY